MTVYNALRGRTRYPGIVNSRLTTGTPSYDALVLANPDLLHYFRMDEASGTTFADSKGALTLTISGTVTAGQSGKLANGKSALFGGGYLSSSGALDAYSKLTIELWTKVSATDTNRHSFYSDRGTGTIFMTGPCIVGGGAAHNLVFEQDAGGVAYGRGSTGQAINDNAWHHVVGVLDGTAGSIARENFKLYLDGAEVTTYSNETHTGSYNLPSTPAAFRVGEGKEVSSTFLGYMCEYAIYSSALSSATIAAHYQSGNS